MNKRIKKKFSIRIATYNKFMNPEYYNRPIWKRRKAIIKHSYTNKYSYAKIVRIPIQKLRRVMTSTDTMIGNCVDLSIHKGIDDQWGDN